MAVPVRGLMLFSPPSPFRTVTTRPDGGDCVCPVKDEYQRVREIKKIDRDFIEGSFAGRAIWVEEEQACDSVGRFGERETGNDAGEAGDFALQCGQFVVEDSNLGFEIDRLPVRMMDCVVQSRAG